MTKLAISSRQLDENANTPEETWEFAGVEGFTEVHLSDTDQTEEEGLVTKAILRTGEWPVIPTEDGIVGKPLRIVRDGTSSPRDGVISLQELVDNFNAGAFERVMVPLATQKKDHPSGENLTRANTGFVRQLWIVDEGDVSKLMAKIEFTEPEVKEKVLRGTYADVSCGIPWSVYSRGRKFGTSIEHVALTNTPFIDDLGPFLTFSVDTDVEIEHYGEGETQTVTVEPAEEVKKSLAIEMIEKLNEELNDDQELLSIDLQTRTVVIFENSSDTTWTATYQLDDEGNLSFVPEEPAVEEEENETDEPPANNFSGSSNGLPLSELEMARRLRELRLSQPNAKRDKEGNMPLTREELGALELSDDARAALQDLLDENASLKATTLENEADLRVTELSDMGLKDRPGALKFYRQVFLSDDGGPAVVLLSDNGQDKQNMSAREVLDTFIDALKSADNTVILSDQHLASGNDNPPPANADDELEKPVEDRLAEAKESLYGKK